MQRKRNEGGRFSAKTSSNWYRQIEEETLSRIEAEWAAKEEAVYLAPQAMAWDSQPTSDEDSGEYDDGDVVPWDLAA